MHSARVRTSQPVQKHTLKLSLCDVYMPKIWVPQTHFWPVKATTSFEQVFEALKEGLSRALTEVPALVGHIGRGSEDPRDLVVDIENDGYVDFAWENLAAEDNIPTYHDLATNGFPIYSHLPVAFSQAIAFAPVSEGSPIFTAKLNVLQGGLALTFHCNHLVLDAPSIALFESLWARHTSDVTTGRPEQRYRLFDRDHETRTRLSTPIRNAGQFRHERWKIFPATRSVLNLPQATVAEETAASKVQTVQKTEPSDASDKQDTIKWSVWYLSAENLAQLKKDAADPSSLQWITTTDAVNGLFWPRLLSARGSSDDRPESSLAVFPLNLRKRLDKSLPEEYFGNAITYGFTSCPLDKLEQGGLSGVRAAAMCKRKAVNEWSQPEFDAWLSTAASLSADEAICPDVGNLPLHTVVLNDYSGLPAHTLDWGTLLGRIDRTRYMFPASAAGSGWPGLFVNPRLADGGLEVLVTSDEQIHRGLLHDQLLQRYAHQTGLYA